jgi:Mn-dependent DtxR family transcriptional regulator
MQCKTPSVQRLARWLLICGDRAHSNTFKIRQDFLAEMLGVRRTSVTAAAGRLRELDLIQYSRGTVCILDPIGLEAKACECYQVIKDHLDNFAEFDTDIAR